MSSGKPIIVFVHGFRGTHHGLALIARAMSAKYSVKVPDLPGFAKGPELDDYSLDSFVSWLDGYIDSISGGKPILLLGHSFGSIVASAYTSRFPAKISRLVLVNPIGAPALEGPRWFMTEMAVLYYKIGAALPEKLARKWLSSTLIVMAMSISMAKTKSKSLRKYIHHQHRKYFSRFATPRSVLEAFETSISHSVRDFAAEVPAPTLLIAGEKDDITPLQKQHELVKMFPDAKLVVIKNVGHLTHYETPNEVASAVDKFVSESKKRK